MASQLEYPNLLGPCMVFCSTSGATPHRGLDTGHWWLEIRCPALEFVDCVWWDEIGNWFIFLLESGSRSPTRVACPWLAHLPWFWSSMEGYRGYSQWLWPPRRNRNAHILYSRMYAIVTAISTSSSLAPSTTDCLASFPPPLSRLTLNYSMVSYAPVINLTSTSSNNRHVFFHILFQQLYSYYFVVLRFLLSIFGLANGA